MTVRHNWLFSASLCDFVLSPITFLEETSGGAVQLRIGDEYEVWVPSTWHILVTDTETYQLDTVNVQQCASIGHLAFMFLPDEMRLHVQRITVIGCSEKMTFVHPALNRGMALVLPIGITRNARGERYVSIVVGPHDLYKYLQKKLVGDIFSD